MDGSVPGNWWVSGYFREEKEVGMDGGAWDECELG